MKILSDYPEFNEVLHFVNFCLTKIYVLDKKQRLLTFKGPSYLNFQVGWTIQPRMAHP